MTRKTRKRQSRRRPRSRKFIRKKLRGGKKPKTLFVPKHCSDGNDKSYDSCLSAPLIRKVAKIINEISDETTIDVSKTRPCYDIHADICEFLQEKEGCKAEACMLWKPEIKKRLSSQETREFEEAWKPAMDEDLLETHVEVVKKDFKGSQIDVPKRNNVQKNKWLSDKNIQQALEALEAKHSSFTFMGVHPIDFSDCHVSRLCSFDPHECCQHNQTQIGIVFNTDPHNKGGTHWFAVYFDLGGHNFPNTHAVYYFDSYGNQAPQEIKTFVNKCQDSYKKQGKKLHYFVNTDQFQKTGSQCGIYAIHFIKQMAERVSFEDYLTFLLESPKSTDTLMEELRDVYFVDPNSTTVVER
jgi:hypothetical protein